MKKIKLIVFLFLINSSGLLSQNVKKIQIVNDNNEAIPFVNIKLSDNFGLISDVNGCFILNTGISRDSLVYISHIAFEPQQLTANNLNDTIHLMPKLDLKQFKLPIPKQNYYIALYNQATLSYDYYPSNSKVNVDVNSVNFNQRIYTIRNKDSFNPYGVQNPKSSVFIGLINTFLNEIQDKKKDD